MAAVAAAGEAGHAPATHDVNQDALDTRNSEHALKTPETWRGLRLLHCPRSTLLDVITCRVAFSTCAPLRLIRCSPYGAFDSYTYSLAEC